MKQERLLDPTSVIRSAAHWRMRAEEMRTLAEDAHSPAVRAMMFRIAADYDRLAKFADDSQALDSMMVRTAADFNQLQTALDSREG